MHMVELFTVLYNFIPIHRALKGRERWSLLRRPGVRNSDMNYILIFIGGGVGSALRYGASRVSLELIGPNFLPAPCS